MPYCIYLEGFDVLFSPWLLLLVLYKLSDDCSLKNNDEHLLLSKKKVKTKLLICFGGFSYGWVRTVMVSFPWRMLWFTCRKYWNSDLSSWQKLINLQRYLMCSFAFIFFHQHYRFGPFWGFQLWTAYLCYMHELKFQKSFMSSSFTNFLKFWAFLPSMTTISACINTNQLSLCTLVLTKKDGFTLVFLL
jgi:hypothetical protein